MAYPHVYIDNSKFRFMIIITTVAATCLFLTFKYVIQDSNVLLGINEEKEIEWITKNNPKIEAQKSFSKGEIKFIEIYQYHYPDPEREEPVEYWIVIGNDDIPQSLLNNYNERLKIRTTCKWGMTDENKEYQRKAKNFAREFNMRMAKLVEKK